MKKIVIALCCLLALACDVTALSLDVTCSGEGSFHFGEGGASVACVVHAQDAAVDSTVQDAGVDADASDVGLDAVDGSVDAGDAADVSVYASDASDSAPYDAGPDPDAQALLPAGWSPSPTTFVAGSDAGVLTLQGGSNSSARYAGVYRSAAPDLELSVGLTPRVATTLHTWFGSTWNVWPDKAIPDGDYDAAIWVRTTFVAGLPVSGYRVQLSALYGDVAIVRWPTGGYLREHAAPFTVGQRSDVRVRVAGSDLTVSVNGAVVATVRDPELATAGTSLGLAVSPGARVDVDAPMLAELPAQPVLAPAPHVAAFSSRTWLGGRTFLFDGDEPILQVPTPAEQLITNVKLRPGYRPLLAWNAIWDISNQGVVALGLNTIAVPTITGGGSSITMAWTASQTTGRFVTRSTMVASYDAARDAYAYDTTSELEVVGSPFTFTYGFDFDHQTPLRAYDWSYQVLKHTNGSHVYRPVYNTDPGPFLSVDPHGRRFWFGAAFDEQPPVVPATEYATPAGNARTMRGSVCAAFNDSGVSFSPETSPAGTIVREAHRITGYPIAEAAPVFTAASSMDLPMLDPLTSYVFAEWPSTTFSLRRRLNEPWPYYGARPLITASNARPIYGTPGTSGIALTPGSLATSALPIPAPLAAGRYLVSGTNTLGQTFGPGLRIEMAFQRASWADITRAAHYPTASGPFAFSLTTAEVVPNVTLALSNGGTGAPVVHDLSVRALTAGEPDAPPQSTPGTWPALAPNTLGDWRMLEGEGHSAFGGIPYNANVAMTLLDLANVTWVTDDGLPALRFGEDSAAPDFAPFGLIDTRYYRTNATSWAPQNRKALALAGFHGYMQPFTAFTIVTWIKPDATQPAIKATLFDFGARQVMTSLRGSTAPYKLGTLWRFQDDAQTATPVVTAGAWHQVAVTAEPDGAGKWRVRTWLDGTVVIDTVPPGTTYPGPNGSLVLTLGAPLYYFNSDFYRGLVGRTAVIERALTATELAGIAR